MGAIQTPGLYIQWLTEIIEALPSNAYEARGKAMSIRDELIREGTRPVGVVRQDAP